MSLTERDVLLICGRYDEERPAFERLSAAVHGLLADVVERKHVRHMIAHRAKGRSSLHRKLWKDREKHNYDDFSQSLSPPMKDLAAARVLLYLPDDIDPVVEAIQAFFVENGHSVSPRDMRSPDRYNAYHFHIDCTGATLGGVDGIAPETVFEIQVCTINAHLWNELEHDIIYKQPSGKPDAAQEELLVALHGELALSARTANRLMRHTNELISKNTAPILDPDGLQYYLRSRVDGRYLHGDFAALFELLVALMDPLTNAALHGCFQTGLSEANARELVAEHDPDGAYRDVGCIVVQLLPHLPYGAIETFVASHSDPPPLFKFARRVAAAVHKMRR